MTPKVTEAKYVEGYKLWLQFSDGKAGVIDLSDELWGPMFEPLKKLAIFKKVRVDPELETVTWPNGADFAPEFLHEHIVAQQIVGAKRENRGLTP